MTWNKIQQERRMKECIRACKFSDKFNQYSIHLNTMTCWPTSRSKHFSGRVPHRRMRSLVERTTAQGQQSTSCCAVGALVFCDTVTVLAGHASFTQARAGWRGKHYTTSAGWRKWDATLGGARGSQIVKGSRSIRTFHQPSSTTA